MNTFVLKAMLESLEIQADEVSTGQQCLDYLLYSKPCGCNISYLLIDLNMPGISGLKVIRDIRKRQKFRELKIYVVTGGGLSDEENSELKSLGVIDILMKPVTIQTLSEIFFVDE